MNLKLYVTLWFFTCLLIASFSSSFAQTNSVQTPLNATPRQAFTPTPQSVRGYWNIDVVGDFTLPPTKSITFSGAGRNLHVNQDWSKLFRRGFSSIDRSRMTIEEVNSEPNRPANWTSRLSFQQRALVLYQDYLALPPFNLPWARNSAFASSTFFEQPSGSGTPRQSLAAAMGDLSATCVGFNDCASSGNLSSFSKIFFDIENEGTDASNQQEHANLYVYKMWALRKAISPNTEIGGIGPTPHNSHGYSRSSDYSNPVPEWLWTMSAQQIDATNTRGRGMPDAIVGKSFGELAHFQMPGTYFLSSDLDYAASHHGDEDRHWLASILGEQEVNMKLSSKKRIAWQWLFNTQSTDPGQLSRAEVPAPPAVAEGMAIFYWFTGAYGTIFWDDWGSLTPNAPVVPGRENLDNNRNYSCYEHYIHGLWRLFKHHGDMFSGAEKYLNQNTECSYDGGTTWYRMNANALKRSRFPFARAIVSGDQILIAASQPYAPAGKQTQMMVRYVEDGYRFYTTINLSGDEIYLGRARMTTGNSPVTPSLTDVAPPPPTTPTALFARVASYNCSTGAITLGSTGGNGNAVEYSAVGITSWTTNPNQVIEAGLRSDPKTMTIHIRQNGVEGTSFDFDVRAYCSGNTGTTNTPPTVVNPVGPRSATVGVGFSLNVGNVFTDAQTPTQLLLSANGLPAGLNLSGNTITGIPSVAGVSTVTLMTTDPGGLATTTTFQITTNLATVTNPPPTTGGQLAARVASYNCSTGALTLGSTGGNGATVEYFAIGITGWTTNTNQMIEAGLRSDPKTMIIRIRQNGVEGTAFDFDVRAYCSGNTGTTNTPPAVVNPVGPRSATVGVGFSLNVGNVFTDAQTPTQLLLSANGLPAGLNLSGNTLSGTPANAGVSTVTLMATDPGGLATTTTFQITSSQASVPVTPPTNTAPTVVNAINPQSATVGTGYTLPVGSVFTDSQTPGQLSLSASGLPQGLSLNGAVITGTPSMTGSSTITLRATDPGGLSVATSFQLVVNSIPVTTPPPPVNSSTCGSPANTLGQPLQVVGVASVNCQNGTFRVITSGGNGSSISYANIVGLNNADPSNCLRVLDNSDLIWAVNNPGSDIGAFQLRVSQNGQNSGNFSFNFKQYCTGVARVASEGTSELEVTILGNPTNAEVVDVEVQGGNGEPMTFRVISALGKLIGQQETDATGQVVRQRLPLANSAGVYLLQVSTPTRSKTVKLVRH